MDIAHGYCRIVFLFKDIVIKIPVLNSVSRFLSGLAQNRAEKEVWSKADEITREVLAETIFSFPFGLFNVMRRHYRYGDVGEAYKAMNQLLDDERLDGVILLVSALDFSGGNVAEHRSEARPIIIDYATSVTVTHDRLRDRLPNWLLKLFPSERVEKETYYVTTLPLGGDRSTKRFDTEIVAWPVDVMDKFVTEAKRAGAIPEHYTAVQTDSFSRYQVRSTNIKTGEVKLYRYVSHLGFSGDLIDLHVGIRKELYNKLKEHYSRLNRIYY